MKNALRYRKTTLDTQEGEVARLKVVQGPDYGSIYIIRGSPVNIGRGEECDVMLTDLKASRKHAQFKLVGNHWEVKDQGSANGILLNGEHSLGAPVYAGDTVGLGETILEFFTKETDSKSIVAAPRSMDQIHVNQKQMIDRRNEIRAMGRVKAQTLASLKASAAAKTESVQPSLPVDAKPIDKIRAWVTKNKKLVIVGALGLAALTMFDDDSSKKPAKKKKASGDRDLAAFLPPDDPAIEKQADVFFRAGFREFREMNYLRAKTEFETVLQMAPGHKMARLYLDKSTQAIEEQVKGHMQSGKRSHTSGKLRDAKAHYEAVLRLLYRDPANILAGEAKDQLERIQQEMRGEIPNPAASPKGGTS